MTRSARGGFFLCVKGWNRKEREPAAAFGEGCFARLALDFSLRKERLLGMKNQDRAPYFWKTESREMTPSS
jgi:hypothetical protein